MAAPYKKIGLIVKEALQDKEETLEHVMKLLKKAKVEVFVDTVTMRDTSIVKTLKPLKLQTPIDLLLVIGGDGTILRAIREWGSLNAPILSINRGGVGFLAEINVHEAETLLPSLLKGEGSIEERSALDVKVLRKKKEVFTGIALNDAVISQGSISRLLDLRTSIGDEYLATYHADGLIISTPTGSTAYSLAAGGPVVHPRLSAFILTPINPHSFTLKPIVIPGKSVVDVDVLKKDDAYGDLAVSLTLDGQVYFPLERLDLVRTAIMSRTVKFVRRKEDTFYHTLRTKLKWGGGTE